jgi:hypothetical protein
VVVLELCGTADTSCVAEPALLAGDIVALLGSRSAGGIDKNVELALSDAEVTDGGKAKAIKGHCDQTVACRIGRHCGEVAEDAGFERQFHLFEHGALVVGEVAGRVVAIVEHDVDVGMRRRSQGKRRKAGECGLLD